MMGNRKYSSDKPNHGRFKKIKTIDATETTQSGGIPHLPQDIIEEILVRLPVKTLLRFKCVAKSWLALISSPNFIKAHVTYSTTTPPTTFSNHRFVLGVSYDQLHDKVNHDGSVSYGIRHLLSNDVADDADRLNNQTEWQFRITGSCNGLLCVSFYLHDIESHTFLWNPCLRMSKKLPPVPKKAESEKIFWSAYGVGYDEPNDGYEVVGLFFFLDSVDPANRIMIRMCNLKNDSWKIIDEFEGYLSAYTSVIYASGKFHFQAVLYGEWSIASLDLENEVYGTIEQPKWYTCYSCISSIAVLKGCISALYSPAPEYADVWVLKEYGNRESWTKLVSIPYQSPSSFKICPPYCLCILANGKYLLGHGRQLLVYNPEDNSYVYRTPKLVNHGPISSMYIYVESLVPLPD